MIIFLININKSVQKKRNPYACNFVIYEWIPHANEVSEIERQEKVDTIKLYTKDIIGIYIEKVYNIVYKK